MTSPHSDWLAEVEKEVAAFAYYHGATYARPEREISASFEIGCFHSVVRWYQREFELSARNLQNGVYRYLTTPNGNPVNFSFVEMVHRRTGEVTELRQQVRIRCQRNRDIAFTPDLVVIRSKAEVTGRYDPAFAGGKQRFFSVESDDVVAAHECKSMTPFPELLIAFLGMLVSAHDWLEYPHCRDQVSRTGCHLAPTLFVGGTSSMWHSRMIRAMGATYALNVVDGLHAGSWNLRARRATCFDLPKSP
jgi:hypothetical protein